MSWNDENLNWDPAQYSGISSIHENMEKLWTPDLYLYNADISSGMGSCHNMDCLINNSSKVICIMPCSHTGHCAGNFKNWPFDRQNCSLTFGSWMKSGEELNYDGDRSTVKSVDAVKHNQWKIIATFFRKNNGKYKTMPNQSFPSLYYAFLIERHSALHVAGIFIPALVLIIVNLCLFWMNIDGYERFVLAGLNMFCHFLYLEQVFWYLPYNGDSVPTVLLFFRDSLFITAILLCETTFLKLINRNIEKPAPWIEFTTTLFTSKLIYGDVIFAIKINSDKQDPEQDSALLVTDLKSFSKDNIAWRTFSNILDKLMFVIIVITYIIMYVALLPENYDDNKWEGIAVESNV